MTLMHSAQATVLDYSVELANLVSVCLSLSLGSTRCVQCPTNWQVNVVVILLGSLIAGILLVSLVLLLNLTVAVGTLNGIIFYTNVVAADTSTFLQFSRPNFISIFISWLNLEIGFDVCFFEGMDAFWKALVQLAFPTYIIILVFLTILLCHYSDRFARLIGRKDPVAALCTMILLSYTKLLQIVLLIGTPSFASLEYPNGTAAKPWLPDATIKYFSNKHIVLFGIGVLLVIAGTIFTIILIFWQCLVRWVKSPRLCNFVEQFQIPYTPKHRYWTGLLLLVRAILYITTSIVNVSNDPAVNMLIMGIVITLLIIQAQQSNPIYKNSLIETLEVLCYMNLLMLCLITSYLLNSEKNHSQPVVAYISVSITIFLLVLVLSYHVYTEIVIKIWRKLKEAGDNGPGGRQCVNNGQPDQLERAQAVINAPNIPLLDDNDEQLMQAVDRGRGDVTLTPKIETDHHNDVATY